MGKGPIFFTENRNNLKLIFSLKNFTTTFKSNCGENCRYINKDFFVVSGDPQSGAIKAVLSERRDKRLFGYSGC